MKKFAVRNLRLCTKECLCLYVCPTGAADTENSIIDVSKCTGCGRCAEACVSGAISLIPTEFPPQQKHDENVISAMNIIVNTKLEAEHIAAALPDRFARALERSNRIMAEDLLREAGYMLPQSRNARKFLKGFADKGNERAEKLLKMIKANE
ncbi:MAG: 4Fe-4S ferredoxin [Methanocorpusculum parvum]|nr:4Fe-4S ferredoxin [Methanocorpusculum parvum]